MRTLGLPTGARRLGRILVRGSALRAHGPKLVREPFHRDGWVQPLRDRRARLEDVIANNDLSPCPGPARDGLEAWKQVIERVLGYIAKDKASVRSRVAVPRWLKVKPTAWTVEDDGWRRRFVTH